MIPHERSLVERLKDKPFALVGVNSDKGKGEFKEHVKEQGVTWPSFWSGSTEGPIPKKWNVSGWPTIYVLDKDGVIRFKNKREKALDKVVDLLLAEMGAETRKSQ